jgi:hypothetical protein
MANRSTKLGQLLGSLLVYVSFLSLACEKNSSGLKVTMSVATGRKTFSHHLFPLLTSQKLTKLPVKY